MHKVSMHKHVGTKLGWIEILRQLKIEAEVMPQINTKSTL